MRRLPPYASLRAFEAVAETLSFTTAAAALQVTQAAVSRQVKNLEDSLGVVLIDRLTDGNVLTPNGLKLHRGLRDGFNTIEAAIQSVSTQSYRRMLTVSVAPYFSATWLSPRIMSFIDQNPDIDLRLHHAYHPPDYRREQVDLGINWGSGRWQGVAATKFLDGSLVPVCAPTFVDRFGPFKTANAIASLPLFCEFAKEDWQLWFSKAGVQTDSLNITQIDDSHALRRVALEGHGIALFFSTLAREDIEFGRLVQPFELPIDTGNHYFLNHPLDRDLVKSAKTFQRWLLAQRRH